MTFGVGKTYIKRINVLVTSIVGNVKSCNK